MIGGYFGFSRVVFVVLFLLQLVWGLALALFAYLNDFELEKIGTFSALGKGSFQIAWGVKK